MEVLNLRFNKETLYRLLVHFLLWRMDKIRLQLSSIMQLFCLFVRHIEIDEKPVT